jgi:hypothetical protein
MFRSLWFECRARSLAFKGGRNTEGSICYDFLGTVYHVLKLYEIIITV